MIIAVDFDGTLHAGEWPEIGAPVKGAVEAMRRLFEDGHDLIIWTCREGTYRTDMIMWLSEHKIPFTRINHNDPDAVRNFGYDARKAYADIYIDDHNLGGLPSWREIYDIVSGEIKPFWIYKRKK